MREEAVLDKESLEGTRDSGRRTVDVHTDQGASRFTAVNGHSRKRSHDRSESVEQAARRHLESVTAMRNTASVQDQQHSSWRSAERTDSVMQAEPAFKQSPDSAKRRRVETESVQESRQDHGRESTKRRLIDPDVETPSPTSDGPAVGMTNGDRRQITHISVAPSSRYVRVRYTSLKCSADIE